MKTYMPKGNDADKKWYIIDAEGKVLGRLATEVAKILRGKHKPTYTPFMDMGDYVIIINADKVVLTGNKWNDKKYRYHTGYPGGLKEVAYKNLVVKHPAKLVELAVKGMLPKNSLGRAMYKKMKVYAGAEHEHQAQKPEVYNI
ncbi:MAG: 50S ribosomal protein L13 [Ruminococcaceae bacterium]|nr:50S ribosomal protein L13 [Oscillospiraceae bacterium]